MTMLVFVPLDWADAVALRGGADLGPRPGCAPTVELTRHIGPDADREQAEYAALHQAGLRALTAGTDPLRLVLAADVDPGQVADTGDRWGGVTVRGLRWPRVSALFADEPATAEPLARARGGSVEAAAQVAELELLWFAAAELDQLRPR